MKNENNIPDNIKKLILNLHHRHGRKKSSHFICEGLRCCLEALNDSFISKDFAILDEKLKKSEILSHFSGVRTYFVPESEFKKMAFTENSQGILLILNKPENKSLEFIDPFLFVLENINDPGNLGTMMRTACSVGLKEIVLVGDCVDVYNPKVVIAGMGAHFRMNIVKVNSLTELLNQQNLARKNVWLTVPKGGLSCYDAEFDLNDSILVVGSEANGIKNLNKGKPVSIPMPGNFESLNVAQAATVFLFEAVRNKIF